MLTEDYLEMSEAWRDGPGQKAYLFLFCVHSCLVALSIAMTSTAESIPLVTIGIRPLSEEKQNGVAVVATQAHENYHVEGEDAFPMESTLHISVSPEPQIILDMDSFAMIANSARPGPPSVATTQLASAVGSVMGMSRDAFLKGLTFYKDTEMGWGLQFQDPEHGRSEGRRKSFNKSKRLYIDNVGGLFTLSRIQNGDYLKTINGRKVGPSLNAERALERMTSCLENDGILSVSTANKELGDDILIQATIIKSRPNMLYENMGMEVWFWGFLCIRSIEADSIFAHTVLRDTDHIISINDIDCKNLRPNQFAEIMDGLLYEVTITVLRRKERWGGMFG